MFIILWAYGSLIIVINNGHQQLNIFLLISTEISEHPHAIHLLGDDNIKLLHNNFDMSKYRAIFSYKSHFHFFAQIPRSVITCSSEPLREPVEWVLAPRANSTLTLFSRAFCNFKQSSIYISLIRSKADTTAMLQDQGVVAMCELPFHMAQIPHQLASTCPWAM